MAEIIVLGGGICGLAAGTLLARDGHEVTLLERDPAPVPATPEEAWENWERDGVSQFRLAHYLHLRGSHVIGSELPDVQEALLAADAARVDVIGRLAAVLPHLDPEPGDARLATHTARRTTLEQIFGKTADAEPRLEVRRGVTVESLLTGPGVECTPGSELEALRSRWPGLDARPLGRVERTLTHRALTLEIFAVERLSPPDGARWVTPREAETLGISAAMQAVLRHVLDDRTPPGGTSWKSSRSPRSRR